MQALAVETIAGVPRWATIGTTGTISALYTVTGGIRAVIWTDIMQFFCLTGALLLVTATAIFGGAGFGGSLDINAAAAHLRFVDLDPTPTAQYSVLALTIGGTAAGMIQTVSDQIAVQRILSASSAEAAQRAYWMKLWYAPDYFCLRWCSSHL
eukprot:SAG31_NODE_3715_length_3955_cov_10.723288_3_plen_153_part_00